MSLLQPPGNEWSGSNTPSAPSAPLPAQPSATPTPAISSGGSRPWLRVYTARPNPLTLPDDAPQPTINMRHPGRPAPGSSSAGTPGTETPSPRQPATSASAPTGSANTHSSFPPHRRLSPSPSNVKIVGGQRVDLHRMVALDRLASGYGAITVEWSLHEAGLDLLAFYDGPAVEQRGSQLVIDMHKGIDRVLLATGSQTPRDLPPSTLTLSNGSTTVVGALPEGRSEGVWPRISLFGVDEFVVVIDEEDPFSGNFVAIARAYGFDEKNFIAAPTVRS